MVYVISFLGHFCWPTSTWRITSGQKHPNDVSLLSPSSYNLVGSKLLHFNNSNNLSSNYSMDCSSLITSWKTFFSCSHLIHYPFIGLSSFSWIFFLRHMSLLTFRGHKNIQYWLVLVDRSHIHSNSWFGLLFLFTRFWVNSQVVMNED